MIGRYCQLYGQKEVKNLQPGMDFRQPKYRREVFLRFYEFHLKYRSHPGCVYYVMPYLAQKHGWSEEQKLWYAYLNGNTQNPVTSWIIFRDFPDISSLNMFDLTSWFNERFKRLEWDTDRRYFKAKFLACIENYKRLLDGGTQREFFNLFAKTDDAEENFRSMWPALNKYYVYFGRLSVFSYMEYLRIMGINVQCDRLFLEDRSGSKSHRNGICKVIGRDDLDWHQSNPDFDGTYSDEMIHWLSYEGELLLKDARERFRGRSFFQDVGYFTMESALCTYKSWHRPNRRYPNVYNDMFYLRIKKAEREWGESFKDFWEARAVSATPNLLIEKTPQDPGLCKPKQNHYRNTGQVIMMDQDWDCFANDFNSNLQKAQRSA